MLLEAFIISGIIIAIILRRKKENNFFLRIKLKNETELKMMGLGKKEELFSLNHHDKIKLTLKNLDIKLFQDKFKLLKGAWDIGYATKGFFLQTALEARTYKRTIKGRSNSKVSIIKLDMNSTLKMFKEGFSIPAQTIATAVGININLKPLNHKWHIDY